MNPSEQNNNAGDTVPPQPQVVQSATPPQPQVQQAQVSQPMTAQELQKANKKGPFKKLSTLTVVLIAVAVLSIGSVAAYLGIVVPNKPENIWKSAMKNSSLGFNALVDEAKTQQEVKGANIEGNFVLSAEGFSGDANISGEFYEKQGQGKIDVGFAGSRYSAEIRAIEAQNAQYPDLYLKVEGINGLGSLLGAGVGSSSLGSTVDSLDGQWIFIDHTAIDQAVSELEANTSQSDMPEITNEEVIEIAETVAEVNERHLFSTDDDTAVFNVVEEVGKEEFEGRDTYKFIVGVNKENLKKYVEELKTELKDTKLSELFGDDYDKGFDELIEEIETGNVEDEEVEVWVDMGTKLIRNVRIVEDGNGDSVLDISLLYEGGDAYPFRFRLQEDGKSNFEFTVTLNTATDEIELAIDVSEEASGSDFVGELKVTPRNEAVTVEKPENTKSLNEVIAEVYGGFLTEGTDPTSPSGSTTFPSQLNGSLFNSFRL